MITSRHNAAVAEVRTCVRKRPKDRFVVEGPHLIEEVFAAKIALDLVLFSARGREHATVERACGAARRAFEVSEEILQYASETRAPQGIVAVATIPSLHLTDAAARGARLLLLDEIRDPGNLGTVARTAWAAGMGGLVLVGSCVDAWHPKVVRASAGAVFHVPRIEFAERARAGEWLAGVGQRAVMSVANGRVSCFEADLRAPLTLVLGNEAHGVHADTARFCSDSLYIPMTRGCESLNLAASAAILCYLALDRARAIDPIDESRQPTVDSPQ